MQSHSLKILAGSLLLVVTCFAQQGVPAKPPVTLNSTAPAASQVPAVAPKPVGPDDIVLQIGDEKFTRARFEELVSHVPQQFRPPSGAAAQKQFATQYGMMLGLARTAEKEKMDQRPGFKDEIEFLRMQYLAQMAFQEVSQRGQVITDEQVQTYYKAHDGEFQQAKVRAIMVSMTPGKGKDGKEVKPRTQDEAKALAAELRKKIAAGADFATVAKDSSDEPETAGKGGDLGTVRRGQLPPNIEKAVFSLKSGEVSEPVPEATGFYLFKVDDIRSTTLEEATPQIRQKLQSDATVSTLDKVRTDYPVKFNDDYFAVPSPSAPPAAPKKP